MHLDPAAMTPVIDTIRRAQAQLAEVLRLLEGSRDCDDVLSQLTAVCRALDAAGFAITSHGLRQCITVGGADSVDTQKLEKLFLSLA